MSIYHHYEAKLNQIEPPKSRGHFQLYDVMNFRSGKYIHRNLTRDQLEQEGYKKPVFNNKTAEDGDLLIIISEKGEAKYQQALDEYRTERDAIYADFKKELFSSAVSTSDEEILEKIFAKAWQDGHSAGLHDVEVAFDEYDDLVDDVLKIERKK